MEGIKLKYLKNINEIIMTFSCSDMLYHFRIITTCVGEK